VVRVRSSPGGMRCERRTILGDDSPSTGRSQQAPPTLDVFGRILAERMKASLGQTIIVENVAGANGSLGVGRVARAAPDGYTVVIGYWGTHVANGAVYTLPYDVLSVAHLTDRDPAVPHRRKEGHSCG
jgi:hypothetical protein